MKKIVFGLMALIGIVFFSCLNDEGYSLNDQWIGFGILRENSVVMVKMDDGAWLKPLAWEPGLNNGADLVNGSRLLLNYTILDEVLQDDGSVDYYLVKINQAKEILLKGIILLTEENADSLGDDAISIENYWMTDSLLNLKLKYLGYNKVHFINLVRDSVSTAQDETIKLEVRHNANKDEEALPYSAYVSFSLNQLRMSTKDSILFEVSSTDYEGITHILKSVFDYSELP